MSTELCYHLATIQGEISLEAGAEAGEALDALRGAVGRRRGSRGEVPAHDSRHRSRVKGGEEEMKDG